MICHVIVVCLAVEMAAQLRDMEVRPCQKSVLGLCPSAVMANNACVMHLFVKISPVGLKFAETGPTTK